MTIGEGTLYTITMPFEDFIEPGNSPARAADVLWPEPPMTDGEFIALAAKSDSDTRHIWRALVAWNEGRYADALRLIGYKPEGDE